MTLKVEYESDFASKYLITERAKKKMCLLRPKTKHNKHCEGGTDEYIFPVKLLKTINANFVGRKNAPRIDPWPAYASNRIKTTTQLFLSPTGTLHRQEKKESKLPEALKPKLLTMIEDKISKDILKRKIPNDVTSPLRLQMYKEAFDMLISNCSCYKRLLSDIKEQYDTYIVYLHDEIKKLLPLKLSLIAVSNECEHKIKDIKNIENNDILRLEARRQSGLELASKVRGECKDLQNLVEDLKAQLAVESNLRLMETDSKKLSVIAASDVNNRMLLMEVLIREHRCKEEDGDAVELEISKNECRKTLEKQMAKLKKLENSSQQTVVEYLYDEALQHLKESYKLNTRLKEEISGYRSRYELLNDHCANLTTYRDLYSMQCGYTLRVISTRAELPRKLEYIGLLLSKWRKMIADKSIEELTDFAKKEMVRFEAGGIPTLSRPNRGRSVEVRSSFT